MIHENKKAKGHVFFGGHKGESSTERTCGHADKHTPAYRQREKVSNVFTDPHPCDLTSLHSHAPRAHGQQQMALSVRMSNPEVACINPL